MSTKQLEFTNIQGNSIGGFKKDFQANLFLKFVNADAARAWILEISKDVGKSSSAAVLAFNRQFSSLTRKGIAKPEELISILWVNLAISFQGLTALNINSKELALFPDAFKNGMAKADIGDVGPSDPSKWINPFDNPADVHALLIVAGDHGHHVRERVHAIKGTQAFKNGVRVLLSQPGRTRSDLPGHEHFGFKDGISQPGIRGVDDPDDLLMNPNQGHPGQDLLWAGEFIIGYPQQKAKGKKNVDGPNPDPGDISKSGPAWTKDGSYLVFRRLRQDVPGFEKSVKALAKKLHLSTQLAGAKLVGRYKSGAPIEERKFQPEPYAPPSTDPGNPHHGNPALGGDDTLNNNFEFSGDRLGVNCPLAAHIRKAYPRDELNTPRNTDGESETQTHRLLRRGIPYGDPYVPHDEKSAKEDRGLLFMCYQNDITSHFEFVQTKWVNNADFPTNQAGEDPLIAQSPRGAMRIDPTKAPKIRHFVTTTGGEYFFSPSISTLQGIGERSI